MKYFTKLRLQQCFAKEINWINGFPGGSDGKESVCIAGDPGLFPGLRDPGGGHSNPLQYSCLENPMDKRAWWIPWTEEPGGLQSMGSQRLGHNWTTNTFISLSPVAYGKSQLGSFEAVFALSLTGHIFPLSWSSWWFKGFYSVVPHHWPHPLFLSILSVYWVLPGTQGLEEWAAFTHK